METQQTRWVAAPGGYELALDGTKLTCRNAKGKTLASVPKKIRDSEVGQQLLELGAWLKRHHADCLEQCETWMLRSLPIPRTAIAAVWADPTWRQILQNSIIVPLTETGTHEEGGLLQAVSDDGQLGVIDLDGESEWITTEQVLLPHPILLDDLDDWRALLQDLERTQQLEQLYREVHPKPSPATRAHQQTWADGYFEQLIHAQGRAKSSGYRVSGGFALCPVWEGDELVEAQYWIGADAPDSPTYSGELLWVDTQKRPLALADVGPVAWSEGVRMASRIYDGRKVEEAS